MKCAFPSSLHALQVSLLCLLICVFGLYALLRKKPRHGGEEGGVEYNAAVSNRHFLVRTEKKGRNNACISA